MSMVEQSITAHLEELRNRIIVSIGFWLVAFLVCYGFAERLYHYVAQPVRSVLPEGSSLVFINATEPFFTYLKIAALTGLLAILPVIFWQIWMFIAPGLYKREKRLAVPFG